jgi:hypothetical protein
MFISRFLIGISVFILILHLSAPLHAAVVQEEAAAESKQPPPLLEDVASGSHVELHAMSAEVATFCSASAAETFVDAAINNHKSRIVEELRILTEAGYCTSLGRLPNGDEYSVGWTGKVMDDGEEITITVYETVIALWSETFIVVEPVIFVCWSTSTNLRCF